MVLKHLTSKGLDELCSDSHVNLLNAIDSLRSQGIDHYISLPQIIVCGDQSSGKSSVLEAISGVAFPVKSNLCTRFPTELILRKTKETAVNVSIVPHHLRSERDKASLSAFNAKLDSFQNLPNLIEDAKNAMGIAEVRQAFSRDLLRIEISGPDRPHLTIVDLPGLIHSENKRQSASDIGLITDVVKGYMTEPRSVILAVVSAKNDYANQIVLKLAREADGGGTRTLGIITKPDALSPGTQSENTYLSLARNQDVQFRLGWHVLRNRDTDTEAWTLSERDANEKKIFSERAWSSLPSFQLGIRTLRDRLSNLLLHQIASELPKLHEEVIAKLGDCQAQINRIGQPRTDTREQRMYLIQVSQKFQCLLQAALHGTYDDPFFGDIMSTAGYEKRFRATLQNLNRNFAETLRQIGAKHCTSFSNDEKKEVNPNQHPMPITKDKYVHKVVTVMDRSRGCELPGTASPMIVSTLFKDQSYPWRAIADEHVKVVWNSAALFLNQLVKHVADETTLKALEKNVIGPALDEILKIAQQKVCERIESHQSGHPITYKTDFVEQLDKTRQERQKALFETALKKALGEPCLTRKCINVSTSVDDLVQKLLEPQEDTDRRAASEALDCMISYYKVALDHFTDDVTVQIVEHGMVFKLRQIFTPLEVSLMSDDMITQIAGECDEIRGKGRDLLQKIEILQKGIDICNKFSGYTFNDLFQGRDTTKGYSDTLHMSIIGPESRAAQSLPHDEHRSNIRPDGECESPPIEAFDEPATEEFYEDNFPSVGKNKKKKGRKSVWPIEEMADY